MAVRTTTQFKALYGTSGSLFPDNTSGDISEADVRAFGEDIADSFFNESDDPYTGAFPQVTATGTDTYAATTSPAISAYATGQKFQIKFTNGSTGVSTLNLNTLGAKKIYTNPTTQATTGDITAAQIYLLIYDAALDTATGGFLMIGGSGSAGVASVPLTLTADTTIVSGGFWLRLQATGAQLAQFVLDSANNVRKAIVFRTGGVERWQIHSENNETGVANAGSDLHFERYDDAGAQIDAPFGIGRTDGVAFFNKPPIMTNSPAVAAKTTEAAPTAWVLSEMPYSVAASDEVTPITASDRITFPWPFPGTTTLVNVIGFLGTPQTSGSIFTIDIEKNGTTILSTLLTIDNTEYNSSTAATPAVISVPSIAFLDRITIVVTQIGDNTAKGLKLIFVR